MKIGFSRYYKTLCALRIFISTSPKSSLWWLCLRWYFILLQLEASDGLHHSSFIHQTTKNTKKLNYVFIASENLTFPRSRPMYPFIKENLTSSTTSTSKVDSLILTLLIKLNKRQKRPGFNKIFTNVTLYWRHCNALVEVKIFIGFLHNNIDHKCCYYEGWIWEKSSPPNPSEKW